MDQIWDFINMQGYGGYVWTSYLVTAGVLIILFIVSKRLLTMNIATLKALENTTKEDSK